MAPLVKGLTWLGVRTPRFQADCDFFGSVLGLPLAHEEPGFAVYDLPNGDRIEVFAQDTPDKAHFDTGPVAGFAVDNIVAARDALATAGPELLTEIEGEPAASQWCHFRGPDGNVYELTHRANR